MPTHNEHESHNKPGSVREGFEVTDVNTPGVVVFLIAMAVSVGVFFVFCYGMGKVINNALIKRDGPPNKWNQFNMPGAAPRNMESNPALQQQQLHALTQRFPTPRLQLDDGNQDVADLHAREDLLLEHYSWIDQSKGTVRIPIERAMQLIVERGLPVAPAAQPSEPLMTGDAKPVVPMPLTDGFARTAYEQQEQGSAREPGEQASTKANNH
ncbi:MAG: hypothetical protein HIU93_13800 [Acidobacteria bacterium]|nr:hypothetical protein [Acidobacteriota bacterium]MBW4046333.1 hypothetical protein [Acidobacteriota bacterium]